MEMNDLARGLVVRHPAMPSHCTDQSSEPHIAAHDDTLEVGRQDAR